MKTYNKEVLRHDKELKEEMYICSLCNLDGDMSLDKEEQQNVKKGHFKLKLHIDNFNEKIKIRINKSIEDKFANIIFGFNKWKNNHIYSDFHYKDIIIEKIKENQKENKNYKYTILEILKICKIKDDLRDGEIGGNYFFQTTKITSYNIIKDINNLEYFEGLELNDNLIDDEILQKYGNEITEKYNNINKCWSHIAPFSRLYLVKLKVVVQLKSQQ